MVNMHSFFKKIVAALLLVYGLHFLTVFLYFDKVTEIKFGSNFVIDLFFFEFEKNVPAFFSSLILVLAGILLKRVYEASTDKYAGRWRFLSGVFYFLAADEWFSLHENLNFSGQNILHAPSWLLFYLPLCAFLGIYLFKFILSLPPKTMLMFIISGFIYVSGAALFEMVSSWSSAFQFNDVHYQIILFFEDGFEMLGITFFIYAILDHLRDITKRDTVQLPMKGLKILTSLTLIEAAITFAVN